MDQPRTLCPFCSRPIETDQETGSIYGLTVHARCAGPPEAGRAGDGPSHRH